MNNAFFDFLWVCLIYLGQSYSRLQIDLFLIDYLLHGIIGLHCIKYSLLYDLFRSDWHFIDRYPCHFILGHTLTYYNIGQILKHRPLTTACNWYYRPHVQYHWWGVLLCNKYYSHIILVHTLSRKKVNNFSKYSSTVQCQPRFSLYSILRVFLIIIVLTLYLSSPSGFSGVRVIRYLVLYVCFVDRCLYFCPFCFFVLFVSDLRQVGGFLSFTNKTDRHGFTEMSMTVALNSITLTPFNTILFISSINFMAIKFSVSSCVWSFFLFICFCLHPVSCVTSVVRISGLSILDCFHVFL